MPETHYYMGKLTTYSNMDPYIKSLLFFYFRKHFPDPEGLVTPRVPLKLDVDLNKLASVLNSNNYKDDFKILQQEARKAGEPIPPLFTAYMNLSPTMRTFGSTFNPQFGNTDDTAIIIKLSDIFPDKRSRYFGSYEDKNQSFDRKHLFRINFRRLPWFRNKRTEDPEERQALLNLKKMKKARVRSESTKETSSRKQQRKARRQKIIENIPVHKHNKQESEEK